MIERWKDTQIYFREKDCKRVAYLSMEFLLGRALQNAIIALGLKNNYQQAMHNLGMNLEEIYEQVCYIQSLFRFVSKLFVLFIRNAMPA